MRRMSWTFALCALAVALSGGTVAAQQTQGRAVHLGSDQGDDPERVGHREEKMGAGKSEVERLQPAVP